MIENQKSTIQNQNLIYHWYALYTKSRQEKKVYQLLQEQNIESYLPLEKKIKQWSDRKKKVEEPMIRSYVFVKTSEKEYYDILNTNGAVRYVTFEGKAAAIPDWQIEAMKKINEHHIHHFFTEEKYHQGDQVIISEGPLKGFEGEIIKDPEGKQKVIIRISNIGYSLVIESPLVFLQKQRN